LLRDPKLVLSEAQRRLDDDGSRARKERQLRRTAGRLRRAEQEEARLIRAYKRGLIGLPTLKSERQETQERLTRLRQEHRKLDTELAGWLPLEAQSEAVARVSREISDALPGLSYERRCELVCQVVDRVVVKDAEVEVHTVLPVPGSAVAMQDNPGVDSSANHRSELLPHWSIDPTNVVRITLFAKLNVPATRRGVPQQKRAA
jgi:hypothetical protein